MCFWQDIPRKKQGIIFVISYYRITISCEHRYLQAISDRRTYYETYRTIVFSEKPSIHDHCPRPFTHTKQKGNFEGSVSLVHRKIRDIVYALT